MRRVSHKKIKNQSQRLLTKSRRLGHLAIKNYKLSGIFSIKQNIYKTPTLGFLRNEIKMKSGGRGLLTPNIKASLSETILSELDLTSKKSIVGGLKSQLSPGYCQKYIKIVRPPYDVRAEIVVGVSETLF